MIILHCIWVSLDIIKRNIDKAVQFVIFHIQMTIYLLLIRMAC